MVNDTLLKMFLAVFSIVISLFLGIIAKNMQDLKNEQRTTAKELAIKTAKDKQKEDNDFKTWQRNSEEDRKLALKGTQVLLLMELNKSQTFYVRQKYCSQSEKAIIKDVYNTYKAAHGNGLADRQYKDIINLPNVKPYD